jgi:hypothetical protein
VPTGRRLRSIWGSSAQDVFVVGDSGVVLRFDGAAWRPQTAPTTRDLRGVWGRGPTEVYAVGDSGTVLRYDGVRWQPVATPLTGPAYVITGVPGSAGAVIGGAGGRLAEGNPPPG